MISPHEFQTSMTILAGAFPDKKLTENMLKAYSSALSDLEEGYLYLAVQDIIKSAKFFPRIAEILDTYHRVWQVHGRRPISYDGEIIEQLEKTLGKDKRLWNKLPEKEKI